MKLTNFFILTRNLKTIPVAAGCVLLLLSSCSSNDDSDGIVPPVQELKHTQLAITANDGRMTTRMSGAITQADEKTDGSHFRGISDLLLVPFRVSATGSDCVTSGNMPLATQVTAGDNSISGLYIGANSKYYVDVMLPVGTNAFLTYGRATGNKGTMAEKHVNGILTMTGTTPADITFTPEQIVPSIEDGKAAGAKGDAIVTYLNTIFNESWTNTNNHMLNGLYEMVQNMKAGSSASVQAFVQEIYDVLKRSTSAPGVADALKAMLAVDELPATMPESVTLPEGCQGFPADLGLPEGAAVIAWNETSHQFEAVTDKNNLGAMNVDVTNFVFPAELYYRNNSRIHTSEVSFKDKTAEEMGALIFNRDAWDDGSTTSVLKQEYEGSALFTANGAVTSSTTVVAITDALQYAVGRLDLKLTAAATLMDNADTPNEIDASKLAITGILIGQQSPVDFLFQSKGGDDFTIYDNQIETTASTIGAATSTHTLVLETLKDQKVNVAVELQNNSDIDIVTGTDQQIVPPGCKFYLVGQLDPTTATGYVADNNQKNRVFCQDYVTTVTFTVKDLTKGYYVIPPLSSANLELSLGVIDWKLSTPSSTVLN